MPKINWINKPFIVLDAAQTPRSALNVIRRSRVQWIVVCRRDRGQTHWYVLLVRELLDRLAQGPTGETIERNLNLHEWLGSEVFVGERPNSTSRHRDSGDALPSANRLVIVTETSGILKGIGEIAEEAYETDQVKRVQGHPFTPHPLPSLPSVHKRAKPRPRGIIGETQTAAKKASKRTAEGSWRAVSTRVKFPLQRYAVVPIFFATDREIANRHQDSCKFSNRRCSDGVLNYGISEVSIPHRHKVGEIESPHWWRLQLFRDPRKHVTLLRSEVLRAGEYFRLLRDSVYRSRDAESFVFIHGFNVSFEVAALRTAQIAFDLQFKGAPILYSWPSRATLLRGYMADEATIDVSARLFQQFVIDVASKTGAKVLHVIAHSMGNRALLLALERLAGFSDRPVINNVILAAPDIDAQRFYQVAEAIRGYPSRVTLYASSRDKAIKASMTLHKAPRAGEAGKNIVIAPSVDTVDASGVDTDFLGHGTFATRRELLGDIFELLEKGTPPDRRFTLEPKVDPRGKYWAFRP